MFVVDSSDTERIDEAKDELAKLLNEAKLKNALFLVFANKQVQIVLCFKLKLFTISFNTLNLNFIFYFSKKQITLKTVYL